MNRLVKKGLVLGTIGFWIGLAIGISINFLSGLQSDEPIVFTLADFLKMMVGGIYGFMPMGAQVIYEIDEWSIFKATATHFAITFLGFMLLAAVQGWLRPDNPVFWIISFFFILCYFLIWLFNYLKYKRDISKMNEDIKEIRSNKKPPYPND